MPAKVVPNTDSTGAHLKKVEQVTKKEEDEPVKATWGNQANENLSKELGGD